MTRRTFQAEVVYRFTIRFIGDDEDEDVIGGREEWDDALCELDDNIYAGLTDGDEGRPSIRIVDRHHVDTPHIEVRTGPV